jgi:hypothetical protein
MIVDDISLSNPDTGVVDAVGPPTVAAVVARGLGAGGATAITDIKIQQWDTWGGQVTLKMGPFLPQKYTTMLLYRRSKKSCKKCRLTCLPF